MGGEFTPDSMLSDCQSGWLTSDPIDGVALDLCGHWLGRFGRFGSPLATIGWVPVGVALMAHRFGGSERAPFWMTCSAVPHGPQMMAARGSA